MLLGAGELGKRWRLNTQRTGIEVIAVDRYPDAPAVHVAHRSHVVYMLGRRSATSCDCRGKTALYRATIEAIATDTLRERWRAKG